MEAQQPGSLWWILSDESRLAEPDLLSAWDVTRDPCDPWNESGCSELGDYDEIYDLISTERYGAEDACDLSQHRNRRRGGFRYDLETNSKFHNQMHCNIGGSVLCSASSPQDPIFWLIHGAVDFHWALWQTCHGYDAIDVYTHFADRTASTNGNDEEYCG